MANKTWFGGTGTFTDGSDWSPGGVPVAGDALTFLAGTLKVNYQNLSDISLNMGGNIGTKTVLDLKGSILGEVSLFNSATPSAPGLHTINVSNYAVFAGPVSSDLLVEDTTINISSHSLLLNYSNLEFINSLDSSLTITGTHGAVVANYGLIEVEGAASANLKIAPSIVGHGTIQVGALVTGTTEFGGLVGDGQTFEFSSFRNQLSTAAKASLQIDMAREFHATIANFTNIDTIDLKGVQVTSDTFSNGVLTLKDGSHTVANLRFAGSYTTSDFVTQAVGGDTLIKHV